MNVVLLLDNMKILMLLSNPFITDLRVYNEAKALTDENHKIAVIIWDRRREYKSEDVVEGIKLIRLHNKLLMKILPNDIFRNPIWWRESYKKGLKLYKDGFNFDVVHCHDLDTLQAGVWLKRKTNCKLVFDAHEIFGYMIRGNISKVVVNQAFKMEKKLIKYVDHVITVNEPLKNYFKKITNAPITIVMNCKDPISDHYEPPKNRVFTVSFISNLHRSRLLPEIIDVLGNIDNIRFVLAGKRENNKLYNEVEETSAKYDNVEFLGQIPFDQVIPRTFEANIVVNPGDPSMPQADIAIPNKLLESMACGRPIICNKGTYAEELTEKLNCGLVVDYDLNAIKEAVIKLRDNPELCEQLGKNGLKNAIKEYNWEKQKEKLLIIYEELKQKY